jgi:hypothetical protein
MWLQNLENTGASEWSSPQNLEGVGVKRKILKRKRLLASGC